MGIARNSLYGIGGTLLPLVASIVTIPLYVREIGPERYGALSIAWLVLIFFGQADLGIGRAVTQRIAGAARGDPRRVAQIAWSGVAMSIGAGLVLAGAVAISAHWYFAGPFDIRADLRGEILRSVWLLALCVPILVLTSLFSGVLAGLERFGLASVGNFAANLGLQVAPLVVAMTVGPDLFGLVLASLISRILGCLVVAAGVWVWVIRGQPAGGTTEDTRQLMRFGSWTMIFVLAAQLVAFADRFAIGYLFGAAAVTAYAIPALITHRTLFVPAMIAHALYPRLAADDAAEADTRFRDYLVFTGQFFAPIAIGLICLTGPLLELWLGAQFDPRSIAVGHLIMVGSWFSAIGMIALVRVQARGDARFPAILALVQIVPYFALIYILGGSMGLQGVAAAFALRSVVDTAALVRRVGVRDSGVALGLAIPASLVMLSAAIGPWLDSWPRAVVAAAVLGLASAGVLAFQLPDELRKKVALWPMARRYPWLLPWNRRAVS